MRARNRVDWGPYSDNLTITCDSVPSGMGNIVATAVHPFNITLTWTELGSPLNGGDTPNFYLLQWKNYENNNAWVNLTTEGGPLVFTFTHIRTTTPFSSAVMQ